MVQGLILFAHGAREPEWAEPFVALATRVRKLAPGTPVRLAFLELMQPDLQAATAELVATGVDTIRIVPIFLGQGGHLRRDLPEQLGVLRAKYGQVEFVCGQPVGDDGAVLDAIANLCVRSLGGS
jgi:sirohydrochlorin cobaltochelatase